MKRVLAVAEYTILEALRDRFALVPPALILAGIPLGLFLGGLTLYGGETTYSATVFVSVSLAVTAVSVLYVNIALRRELDGHTALQIFASPVPGLAWLAGKHLGYWAVATVYVVLGMAAAVLSGAGALVPVLAFGFGLWLLQCVVTAWSMFFALLMNSLAASVAASALSWALFTSARAIYILAGQARDGISGAAGKFFYYILPDYSRYDFRHAALYGGHVPWETLAVLPFYTAVCTLLVICLMWLDFSGKEY